MSARQPAQPGEAADVLHDLGDPRGASQRLDALDELVAGVDVHAGIAVSERHVGGSLAPRYTPEKARFRRPGSDAPDDTDRTG